MIRFYKHVQTCQNIMMRFDTILHSQTCLDLSKYDEIHKNCPKWLKFERIGNQNLTLTTTTKLFQGPRAFKKFVSREKDGIVLIPSKDFDHPSIKSERTASEAQLAVKYKIVKHKKYNLGN